MSCINKKIQHFSLLLALLIIIAHMIIPHDHHLAGVLPGQADTCPYPENETGNHRGFPIHCHAFNDLKAEEAYSFVFSAFIHLDFNLLNSAPDIYSPELNFFTAGHTEIPGSIPDLFSDNISLLRAPPQAVAHIA
jgi:hypothetical protein